MKKQIFILLAAMFSTFVAVQAQPGGGQRRTVEERVKSIHQKIDSAYKPEAAKMSQIDSVFAMYYRSTDKIREDLMSGGERPDFQVMREKMQPAVDARDKELKVLLGDQNYKKWKEELEPSLMQRRGGGGGGGGNNRQK